MNLNEIERKKKHPYVEESFLSFYLQPLYQEQTERPWASLTDNEIERL